MTRQRRTPETDHSTFESVLQELAYQIWASLGVPKRMEQVHQILRHLPRNEGLLAELSARSGAPIVLPDDYSVPDLKTLWEWHNRGDWLGRSAQESVAASRAEEVQVAAAVSKERPGLKMRRMDIWSGVLAAVERELFETDEEGNALIGIVRRIESTEDIARLERVAKIMHIATRNLTLETGEVLPSRPGALQVDRVLKPEGSDAKGSRPLVISTVGELDPLLEQQGEQEIDPRLKRMVREDMLQEGKQKIVELARSCGWDVRLRQPTPEEEEALEEMKRRDADKEAAWDQSH